MSSSLSMLDTVQRAVKQAGRSAELYDHTKVLLNLLLRDLAQKNRYAILRKVGTQATLAAGSQTASAPSDIGAGVESLIFGDERVPMVETDITDFVGLHGFPAATVQATRPTTFYYDKEAALLRFNAVADKDYAFIPIYFKLPAPYATDGSQDSTKIWYENDLAIIAGLVWAIFQYTDDAREVSQYKLFRDMDADYRRGMSPLQAGSTRVRLSPRVFRTRPRGY